MGAKVMKGANLGHKRHKGWMQMAQNLGTNGQRLSKKGTRLGAKGAKAWYEGCKDTEN